MFYLFLKLLHIASVIIFLGNILTGLFWMRVAVKARDLKIISHSIKAVIRSDQIFNIPGLVMITTFGIFAAVVGKHPLLRTGWIFWSLILLTISGFVFGRKISPLQKKIYTLTSVPEENNFDWPYFRKVFIEWEKWVLVAFLMPVIAFILMILKVPAKTF